MNLSRRLFLHSGLMTGAALAVAPKVFAEPTLPGWHVGYSNAPAAGYPQAEMKLVRGKAPAGLTGTLYRNGPAHFKHGDAYATHWFDGDGMVQRIAIGEARRSILASSSTRRSGGLKWRLASSSRRASARSVIRPIRLDPRTM
jgi:all-trans-8'-apo-beta-carotenal 15,15'-oxygenase